MGMIGLTIVNVIIIPIIGNTIGRIITDLTIIDHIIIGRTTTGHTIISLTIGLAITGPIIIDLTITDPTAISYITRRVDEAKRIHQRLWRVCSATPLVSKLL